jgi:anti-sigma factor RsiW
MTKPPISEEMLNAFVDRQLCTEDRLRILRSVARDRHLGREICDRQRMKELIHFAYSQPAAAPAKPRPTRRAFPWRWWRS